MEKKMATRVLEKEMEMTIMGYIGTAIRTHSFFQASQR